MNIEIFEGGELADMGTFLSGAISQMKPQKAQAVLGAIFANMVGNIPQEKWEKIKAASQLPCECGDPRCGDAVKAIFAAAEVARVQFKRITEEQTPNNPDEKGFSE